jgi:tRNA1(Val) A37 N6-methylase TrmN6
MPEMMFKVIMNPPHYQKMKKKKKKKKKWMIQEHIRLSSLHLLVVSRGLLAMMSQVVAHLKGAKTWEVLMKLGEMIQMVVPHVDRVACRRVTSLGN